LAAAAPAWSQTLEDDPVANYQSCLEAVATQPERALEQALAWAEADGGSAARHCLALALAAAGDYAAAARGLDVLAGESAEASARARLYAQAGQVWLLADRPQAALAAFDAALAETPDDVELLIDRARSHAAARDYESAIADLDGVVARAPDNDEALVFRAAAHRRVDDFNAAAADLERALAIDPANADALVERGAVHLHHNDETAARADFGAAIMLAPTTPAAALAREFLNELERERRWRKN
jgi:tetratricopeptide (TPR) repeat protein